VGDRWGRVYSLGDKVEVTLAEADPMTGGITLRVEQVLDSANPEVSLEDGEPVARGGPGKGRRRHAAQRSATARGASAKAKKTKAKAKASKKTAGKGGAQGPGTSDKPGKGGKNARGKSR
jgi:ribonuclease R